MTTRRQGYQTFTDGFAHVASPGDVPGTPVNRETDGQSTTQTAQTFSPGLRQLVTSFLQGSGAAAVANNELYLVVNALDASDATTKLAAAGSRYILKLGETLELAATEDAPITNVYYKTKVAETGTNLVRLMGKAAA